MCIRIIREVYKLRKNANKESYFYRTEPVYCIRNIIRIHKGISFEFYNNLSLDFNNMILAM